MLQTEPTALQFKYLNSDKAFNQLSNEIDLFSLDISKLSNDWLKKLAALLSQYSSLLSVEVLEERLNNKVGITSTYANKQELINNLKRLYYLLSNESHDTGLKLNTDDKSAICHKLLESQITECPEGFHDRVNDILLGLFFIFTPKSLNELLVKIRQDIVSKSRIKKTDDVHANTRFFNIANTMGFGIRANNLTDPYRGGMQDDEIIRILTNAFLENYQPFFILKECLSLIESILRNKMAYKGKITTGSYKGNMYLDAVQLFRDLFKDETIDNQYLVTEMDEENFYMRVLDVNWEKIKLKLWQMLNKDYFKFSKEQQLYIETLIVEKKFTPYEGDTLFVNKNEYHQLVEFINDLHDEEKLAVIFDYLDKTTEYKDNDKVDFLFQEINILNTRETNIKYKWFVQWEKNITKESFKHLKAFGKTNSLVTNQ